MNTKALAMSMALLMLAYPAMADDQTITVNFDVSEPTSTGFTVTSNTLSFAGTNNINEVAASTNPWTSINNTGNVNETVKMNYTGTIPVKIGTTNVPGSAISVGGTFTTIIANLEKNVPTNLFAWANFSGVTPGPSSATINVNTTTSSTP